MPEAIRSPAEPQRLAAVKRVGLLGTPAEERFDRITRLARRLFNVPMAVIDIIGEDLAWLKSAQGMDEFVGLRCHSYCHHTVLEDQPFVVNDASTDPRVHDSGFATSWVFYAGIPLHFEGHRVGVLCIGDTSPRDIDAEGLSLLRDLAAMAEQELMVSKMSETQLALARSNKELEMKANVDVLTRVWNRGAIMEIAENERLHAMPGMSLAVLLIDLDHFKSINDVYGHLAGDEVLRISGERLRASIRPTDAVGRYGGEEFMVVMTNVQREDVAHVAERIRSSLAKTPIRLDKHLIEWTCSAGYAIGDAKTSIHELVQRADQALYRAKSGGRNRIESEQQHM